MVFTEFQREVAFPGNARLGIKGNLGLVWDRIAYHNSSDFNQSLADLATIIKADLTIVDAIRALATRGPQGPGKVLKLNSIIAGTDPVAVDATGVRILEAQRRAHFKENRSFSVSPKHIQVAQDKYRLGVADPGRIELVKLGWTEGSLI